MDIRARNIPCEKGTETSMLTIIHGADFHLDARLPAPGQAQGPPGQPRRWTAGKLAESGGRAVMALSGDLLDGGQTLQGTITGLARTLGASRLVFIAPGNHDYGPRSVYAGRRSGQRTSFPPWRWRGWAAPQLRGARRPSPPPADHSP